MFIVLICVAYVIGILWGLYLGLILGMALFCLLICLIFLFKDYIDLKKVSILIIISFIGCAYANFRLNDFKEKYKEETFKGEVKILSLVNEKEYYSSYICKNEKNNKMIISIPKGNNVNIGETIYCEGDFEKPTCRRNTGGYDYSLYLYSQNIYGTIKNTKNIYTTELSKFNLIYEIQQSIFSVLGRLLPKEQLRYYAWYDNR